MTRVQFYCWCIYVSLRACERAGACGCMCISVRFTELAFFFLPSLLPPFFGGGWVGEWGDLGITGGVGVGGGWVMIIVHSNCVILVEVRDGACRHH